MALKKFTEQLTLTTDQNGNRLATGDRVRSYDHPEFADIDLYVEGRLEAIGDDVLEGCPRYRILVDKKRRPSEDPAFSWDTGPYVDVAVDEPYHVYPPVNGALSIFGFTHGVVLVKP